ncbi:MULTISPECIES: IclR family transcriptional regulator [Halorubrum]|uniref:IclR family transcriptional regulator n=1 Tax=Halorubrum tropicale TaxID=1765655 RepID=A0A0N0BQI0_9EURY|nr:MULTISPECIES: IclR family transcriptional regulator [Halorubrum]KOX95450.1 IclR family transcriptional regulator [Halorubrum tropicale]MDB2238993.1 IclR family transcriptional regulator [Halorubrum ezzemoulense]MDB2249730.1 IclR family transcriptional regulator [Halorubrum ezzemoulense]
MKQSRKPGKGIKSDETLFALIETLREVDGAGVTELADRLDIAKSTIHGHLTSMREHGFVVKRGGEYHLGLGFFDYGQYVRGQLNIFRSGMEAVDDLERATGEMAWLITHENGKAMYIYGRGGQNNIDINTILGQWSYMHCNSGGKAILAHLPEEEIHAIVDEYGLPSRTENTITTREALFDELAQIREQGYALNLSEDLKGIHAIGVPLTFEGEIQGALSIAGPAHRLSKERCKGEVFDQLRAATDEIEMNLAYR